MGLCRTDGISLCPKPGFRYFEPIYAYQRTAATEMWLPHGSIAVPCTPFSDGKAKSKYRNPGLGHSEAPAIRHKPIYLLLFSVTSWLRGALLIFGCGSVALCFISIAEKARKWPGFRKPG